MRGPVGSQSTEEHPLYRASLVDQQQIERAPNPRIAFHSSGRGKIREKGGGTDLRYIWRIVGEWDGNFVFPCLRSLKTVLKGFLLCKQDTGQRVQSLDVGVVAMTALCEIY